MSQICFGLDLSSPKGSFCLFEESSGKAPLLEKELPGAFTHSETLLGELQTALDQCGVDLSEISKWITVSGPGSFTGLRIAYATLKAFALSSSKPVITVEGPEARAYAFFEEAGLRRRDSTEFDVLSYLTADKLVISTFEITGDLLKKTSEAIQQSSSLTLPNNRLVLTEERILASTPSSKTNETVIFPLRAGHLKFFPRLGSRREYSLNEISQLTPLYFGSSHFD